jgi:negative regulator of flagellin synthesis FlgM
MKIYGKGHELNPAIKHIRNKKEPERSTQKQARSVEEKDRLELSQTSKDIQKAQKLLDFTPDIRKAKVARIKRMVDDGTYKVDKEKIADKILRESLENELF